MAPCWSGRLLSAEGQRSTPTAPGPGFYLEMAWQGVAQEPEPVDVHVLASQIAPIPFDQQCHSRGPRALAIEIRDVADVDVSQPNS